MFHRHSPVFENDVPTFCPILYQVKKNYLDTPIYLCIFYLYVSGAIFITCRADKIDPDSTPVTRAWMALNPKS